MAKWVKKRLDDNILGYKNSLERIIEKYSKLKDHDGGIEVDVHNLTMRDYMHYVKLSEKELSELELSESCRDSREQSPAAQDITRDTQWDSSYQDVGAEDSVQSDHSTMEHDAVSGNDNTQLDQSSMDETQGSVLETSQPEDHDEELERTLSSQGSYFKEQYPSMIIKMGKVLHCQHVSEAANSVLRRYRRLRGNSIRGSLNRSFNVTLRSTDRNPKKMVVKNSNSILQRSPNTSLTKSLSRASNKISKPAIQSPMRPIINLQDWEAERQSSRKVEVSVKRDLNRPVQVMDFSFSSRTSPEPESPEPEETPLNQTFTISQASSFSSTFSSSSSQQREQPTALFFSPARSCTSPSTRASMRPSLRSGPHGLALASHPLLKAIASARPVYEMEPSVPDSSAVLCSPARQSPYRTRLMSWEGQGGSPHVLSRSPNADSVGRHPRDAKEPRSVSASFSLQTSIISPRKLRPQESYSSSQSKLSYSQSSTGAGRHRLRRHLSFDSSFLSSNVSHRMKLEAEFQKQYHRFVCQSEYAPSNAPPCRLCAKSSESSRVHSSTALEALALSPHHSVIRKRNRELDHNRSPNPKRSRDWDCAYSPGSLRYKREMQRCQHHSSSNLLLSTETQTSHYLMQSPSKAAVPRAFITRWPSSETNQ